jgi:hypothetical protein
MRVKDIDERGFVIAEMSGARLGAEVLRISEEMECRVFGSSIDTQKGAVTCPGQEMTTTPSTRLARQYDYVPAEARDKRGDSLTG